MTYKTRHEVAALADLEIIFTKIYSAEKLKTFFNQFLKGAVQDQEIFNLVESNPVLHHPGKMLKRHTAVALCEVFQDKRLLLTFYNQQSDICRKALDHIVWHGAKSLAFLEHLVRGKIALKNESARGQREPFSLKNDLELFLLETDTNVYSYHKKYRKKDSITVFLPQQIIDALRNAISKPPEYYIIPVKRKPKTAFKHRAGASTQTAIPRIVQFIKLGHLPLKKNGQATVKGLRELGKVAGLAEFYPDSEPKELRQLKSIMLSTFLLSARQQTSDPSSKPHNYLRKIFQQWLKRDDLTFIEQFLGHLRILRNNYIFYNNDKAKNIKKDLRFILKELPMNGKWVSMTDILSFVEVRQINLLEFNRKTLEFRHYEESKYCDWEDWESVTPNNIKQVINTPVLKSFFFLSAALGLVEIGYNIPENSNYRRLKQNYLTEYDGLQLVKLTALGAYVVGNTKKYEATNKENATCKLHLSTTRLLLTMEGNDPLTVLNLRQVMTPAGKGRYILTHASLLKSCNGKHDVENKIALFKQTISQTLPQIWQDFFKLALKRINPLSADPAYRVFKITPNQEFLNILTSDPDISSLILKVEGLRVAVELPKLNKLIRLLKNHGFLVANSALFTPEYLYENPTKR